MRTFLCTLLAGGLTGSVPAAITGQWDFAHGDLAATIGAPLQYRGTTASQTQFGTTAVFGIASLDGEVGRVMRFPAASPTQGFVLPHGAAPNGGGAKVNQYTLILDVMFPAGSTSYRAFWQTDPSNATDADVFVNASQGLGISGSYQGNLSAGAWHRVAFTFDLTQRAFGKYIDGTNVLTAPVGAAPLGTNLVQYLDAGTGGVDGRWALEATALLFTDDDNETGVGYVSSIQFHDRVLTAGEIAALGRANAAGIPQWTSGGIAQWDFNGNLAATTGAPSLVAGAAAPAATPGVTFTEAQIAGQPAQVAAFTRGTFFRFTHGLAANGGGNLVNQYTLLMDVMFSSRPSGWAALWQTSPSNANDGDWFINPAGGLGISGVYAGNVPDGTWNRLALVVDSVAGTFTSYLNGAPVQQTAGPSLDGRWALDATALLFADEDQENAAGYVNSVQLRSRALSAADVAALGSAQASGVPLPQQPTGLRVVSPNGGEVFTAGTTQTIAWVVNEPGGLLQLDLLIGNLVYRTLGQVPMRQGSFAWAIEPRLGDTNNYRLRLTSLDFPAVQDVSDATFSVTGSGEPPNLLFGQPLERNGGFELGLTHWQFIAGQPVTFTSAEGRGTPFAGTNFLFGGRSPGGDFILRQDIDLLAAGFTASDLDAGAAVEAEAWLRSAYPTWTFDDLADFRVACLDSFSRETASFRSLIAGNNTWTRRTVGGLLPPGTRTLRVEILGQHRRDADNACQADAVAVRLQRVAAPVSPQITKLPMLQDYRQDAMTLFWETDGNQALHQVEWGRSNVTEQILTQVDTIQIDAAHFVHRATLTGLTAETRYHYRVRSGDAVSAPYAFRTAPRRETPFSVAWWGDSQVGPAVLQQLIPIMLAQGVDWLGVAGDLVTSGASLSDWQNYWFGALEFQNIAQTHPALFARGNHDGEHPYCYAYSALPGNGAWYAFDYGNARFIFLDTEAPTSGSPEQYAWLVNELRRPGTQNAAFRVVCFHRLPYANLWNGGGYTGEPWVRSDWVPLFQQYNVDVVINGHAHNYNRGTANGVTYTVVGGGGGALDTERVANWPLLTVEYSRHHFALMRIAGHTLDWTVYDNTNVVLDRLTLPSRIPQVALHRPAEADLTATLVLSGKPGVRYVMEYSTSLTDWSPLSTNTVPDTGLPVITNTVPLDGVPHFFRARVER